jgi:hypothetical protein
VDVALWREKECIRDLRKEKMMRLAKVKVAAVASVVLLVALSLSGCSSGNAMSKDAPAAGGTLPSQPLKTRLADGSSASMATPELVFSNGVRIALLGICEYPVKGRSWWRPDGQMLAEPPYAAIKEPSLRESESLLFPWCRFALQIANPQHLQLKWRIESSGASSAWFMAKDGVETHDGTLRLDCSFMEVRNVAKLQFGVPLEAWQTRMTASPDDSAFGIRGHVTGRILSMPSAENSGTFRFRVTHDSREREARVVIVTTGGQTRTIDVGEKDRGKDIAPVFSISGYKPGEIREIQFQTCRFEWREFKDVPLHPKGWMPGTPQWVIAHTAELPFATKEVGGWLSGNVTFSDPRQERGRTLVDAKYMAPAGRNTRIVAMTADGAMHISDSPVKRLSNGVVIARAGFPNLPIAQIRAFALEVEIDK